MSNLDEPIFVSSEEDLIPLKKCQKIQFICRNCGALFIRQYSKSRAKIIKKFLCRNCNSKKNFLEKFGYENPAQVPSIKEKIQKTCLERYGNVCSLNGGEPLKKRKETWKKNFGKENPFQKESVRQKVKQNNIEKYGTEYAFCLNEFREKSYQTRIKKYGSMRTFYLYEFNNLKFDSMWKIYFYIYCRDAGKHIEREPLIIEYFIDRVKYRYYPDFRVDGELFEIKSNYYLKLESQEKLNIMKENNVVLVLDKEIYFFEMYAKTKYPNLKLDIKKILKDEC